MLRAFQFTLFTRLHFRPGGIQRLGEEVKNIGGRKILLVTDKGVKGSGLLERAVKPLEKEKIPYVIFDEVEPNPSVETVEKGFELLKGEGCDSLVAVGGGSPIDAAKGMGVLATNPDPLIKYEGANKIPNAPLPLVAVPTTAGTGSEVTGAAVITDKSRKYKCSIRSPLLLPRVALLDPELLCTLPPAVLASTSMDALTHAYEAFVSSVTNPVSQALAYDSIRLIGLNVRRFYANPDDLEAAGFMMLASTMAGTAFFNGRVGVVHAMAHPLGGFFNIPHGVANAILLPHCMDFSRMGVPEKFARIAEALGEDIRGMSVDHASRKAVEAVREMMADIRIPAGLREVGAKREAFEALAKDAVESGIHLTTPRKTTYDDIMALYEAAY
ncbi:MAG: iron-containing alcohol dehydrogenase [Deltaproteobacteria bacterium]|nr:iron-containing alcohol dehydrogenase [Deltaproteobacteria bacterium]MBW2308865.1 iron-containing alcohol dehydrogenase [Deltaproteobacteria bacterium]